jgi:hypothetical protein
MSPSRQRLYTGQKMGPRKRSSVPWNGWPPCVLTSRTERNRRSGTMGTTATLPEENGKENENDRVPCIPEADKISKGYRKNWAGGFRKSTRSIPCLARSVGGSYGSPPYAKRLISIPPLIPSILRIRGIHYQFSRLFSSYPHSGYPNTPEISSILADMLCILLLFGPADFHVT